MNKKSLIYHIVWSITFIVLCYVFGSIYSLITNGFIIERKLQYITIAVICKPIMYLILGLMFGLLIYMEVFSKVTKKQMMIEMLIVEIPIVISVLNEFIRDLLVNYGFQIRRIIDKPFRSARIIAITYILLLFIVRRKLLFRKEK